MHSKNPYVPENMPAIGDLFDMFAFDRIEIATPTSTH